MAGPGLPSRTSALPRLESAGADSGDGAAAFAVNALPSMSPAERSKSSGEDFGLFRK